MKNEELNTLIEKSLKINPAFHLAPDFAKKVTFAAIKREQWKVNLKEYLIVIVVIISLLAVAVGLNYYMDKSSINRMLSFVTDHIFQVISVIFILNFIFFTDRVLLPLLFNKYTRS